MSQDKTRTRTSIAGLINVVTVDVVRSVVRIAERNTRRVEVRFIAAAVKARQRMPEVGNPRRHGTRRRL